MIWRGRSFFLSECQALPMMTKKANCGRRGKESAHWSASAELLQTRSCSDVRRARFGGNPNSCPTVPLNPRDAMMVGAKYPNAFREFVLWHGAGQWSPMLPSSSLSLHSKVLQSEDPETPITNTLDSGLLVEVLVGPLRRALSQTGHGKDALLLGQEFGCIGKVGEGEPDDNADDDGGNALEDELRGSAEIVSCQSQVPSWPPSEGEDIEGLTSHCHPRRPATPFISPTPAAMRLPKAPDTAMEAEKMAILVARSLGLYCSSSGGSAEGLMVAGRAQVALGDDKLGVSRSANFGGSCSSPRSTSRRYSRGRICARTDTVSQGGTRPRQLKWVKGRSSPK